ncbi:alpha-galactosidase [Agromyces sp. NPDC056965]|uniref:alpha-galactosidase n=1 Tax=Agromyces sp. NPDC056965 TaxID=3345983 RepID=UPI003624E2B4
MTPEIVLLRGGSVALAVDCRGRRAQVVHWGADLGALDDGALRALADSAVPARLNATPDDPLRFSLLPTQDDAWTGRPAVALARGSVALNPRFLLADWSIDEHGTTAASARFTLRDDRALAEVVVELALDRYGVLEHRREIRNLGPGALSVEALNAALPLPRRAAEILDFTGAWIGERTPQRLPVAFGTHAREQRRGRTGHDSSFATIVGTPGFGNRRGEVWAMHTAWSGDQAAYVERSPDGAGGLASSLSGGELLRRGEIELGSEQSCRTAPVLFTWSERGLDGISERFHARLRARTSHPTGPRPLVLNTWEAVYLDQDLETLVQLADQAAEIGVERFVLDDGWFRGRRTDRAGLGDWYVDEQRWPDGLHPLVDRVRAHGMEFGLWVEPEMINPDSDAARDHPDWFLTPADGWLSRSQHVLDLANPEAANYILERLDALVDEYRIDFLKWDHNRDILEAATHAHTRAVYSVMDALRARHHGLEIESCASGGARVDLGVLERTDRVWASDTNDPIERERIQRWTSLLLPLELIGSHVGESVAHTTGRTASSSLQFITALFGHSGLELNLLNCTAAERANLSRFAGAYRELRGLVHSGVLIHADIDDEAARLFGVVSPGRDRALLAHVQLGLSVGQQGRVLIPGLDPDFEYDVRIRTELGHPDRGDSSGPAWFDAALAGRLRLPGAIIERAGLSLPPLRPGTAALIEFARVSP